MKPRKFAYLAHRWLALFIALQLLAWSVGGFTFSVLDIRDVRGESAAAMRPPRPLDLDALPAPVADACRSLDLPPVARAELIDRGLGPRWELRDEGNRLAALLLPDGRTAPPLTRDDAERIALDDLLEPAAVRAARLIDADPPTEYREKPLPAWQVVFERSDAVRVYVHAGTGEIAARRNRAWRTFDFFWMLHTMDYQTRDDFNHPLLTIASLLAVATAATGLSLWAWRLLPSARRQRTAMAV
ncbi:MAG: PepSY domain-containing protein [Phycisphaerae bacterium]|nr:PepSY domain-containing protein [Phycisphaerae bacterium]